MHVRKSRHEAFVVRDHGTDLRLLQHHLRHPHPIRGGILLPGQVVAPMNLEPREQRLGKLFGRHHLPNNPCKPFFFSTSCSFCFTSVLASASTSGRIVGLRYVPLTFTGMSASVEPGAFKMLASSW